MHDPSKASPAARKRKHSESVREAYESDETESEDGGLIPSGRSPRPARGRFTNIATSSPADQPIYSTATRPASDQDCVLPRAYQHFHVLPHHLRVMIRDYLDANPTEAVPVFANKSQIQNTVKKAFHYEDLSGRRLRMSSITLSDRNDCTVQIAEGSPMVAAVVKWSNTAKKKPDSISAYLKWGGGDCWETRASVFKIPDDERNSLPNKKIAKPTISGPTPKVSRTKGTPKTPLRPAPTPSPRTPPHTTPQRAGVSTRSTTSTSHPSVVSDALANRTTFAFYLQTSTGSSMRKRSFRDCGTHHQFFDQAAKVHRFSSAPNAGEVEAVSCRIAQLPDEPEQMLFRDDEEDYVNLLERVTACLKGQRVQQQGVVVEVRVLGG